MAFRENVFNSAKILLCGFGIIATFYMVTELTCFTSTLKYHSNNVKYPEEIWLRTSRSLLQNMALLTLFIIQHSLFASQKIKEAFNDNGLQVIFRSVYVIATSGILLYLMKHWKTTHDVVLWQFNLDYRPFFWIYASIHVVAWVTIYVGNICCDVTELLGMKQVYYSIVNLPDPNSRKSVQLQRLNSHMRHPSFLAFVLIFWMYPIMSLDRLLLATIMTGYMYIAWNTDGSDYHYHKYQYDRKHHELDYLQKYNQ
ncbi:unnamed protein product [Phaedon cochleariae]|uniref:Nuclear envelope membrane protein n=1 Tax=Phaedon cochleariae TaxID=80249 RepID=A0A9N9SL64_PHACE|nr:unnamed protein product [Phaedon cochleariae]